MSDSDDGAEPIHRIDETYDGTRTSVARDDGSIVLTHAIVVLHVEIVGALRLVLLVLSLLVVGSVDLGIPLAFYARNELEIVQFVPLVLVPQIFLGVLVLSVETPVDAASLALAADPAHPRHRDLREMMLVGPGSTTSRRGSPPLIALATVARGAIVLGVSAPSETRGPPNRTERGGLGEDLPSLLTQLRRRRILRACGVRGLLDVVMQGI